MHRTLFPIPHEILGLPVFGFGLLLWAWVLFGLILMVWLVRRQGFNADTNGYLMLLVPVAAILYWLLPAVCEEQGLPIRGYGVMFLLGVVSGTALATWRAWRRGIDPDLILSLSFWMFIPGIVGARAFYVIEYWPEQYLPYFQKGFPQFVGAIVNVTQGGLVVYGGLLGGALGMLLFVRRARMPLLATCDLIAPSMLLGLTLGRIGCLLNGCCFGGPCEDVPWAVSFPADSPPYLTQVERGQMYGFTLAGDPDAKPVILAVAEGSAAAEAGLEPGYRLQRINGLAVDDAGVAHRLLAGAFEHKRQLSIDVADQGRHRLLAISPLPDHSLAVHPTQVYSAVNAALLCLLLLAFHPFRRRDGETFALMLTVYPIARYLLEIIRTDESGALGTALSISQNVSLALLACTAVLWYYILRQPRGTAFP